jgi:hypothetical protein
MDAAEGEITISPCRVTDLKGSCSAWDGTPLDFRLDGSSATEVTGAFTVPALQGEPVLLTLDDPGGTYFGAAARLEEGLTSLTIPVVANADLDEILVTSNATPVPGTGVTVLHLVDPGGAPAAGALLGVARSSDPWYATDVDDLFVPDGPTGSSGVAAYLDLVEGDFTADAELGESRFVISGYAVSDALVVLEIALL